MHQPANPGTAATVGPPTGERVLIWLLFPLLGAGAGWLVDRAATWMAGWPLVPFRGVLRLIDSAPEPAATLVALGAGAALGLVIALLAEADYVTVDVATDHVRLRRGRDDRSVARAAIGAAFVDRKQLVLLGPATEEIARQAGDLPAEERLRAAFEAHGYPWVPGGDPHMAAYRPWLEGQPDLPAGADGLLRARSRALARNDRDGAQQLREALAALGVVVREEGRRQSWRPGGSAPR